MLPTPEGGVAVQHGAAMPLRDTAGNNLGAREGRKAMLAARFGGRGVAFADMEAVLKGGEIPQAARVVVFDNNIDEQGHKGTEQLPLVMPQLVRDIRQTVARLHDAGIGVVHVLTDHGFLLLAPDLVDGLGRPELPVAQAHTRSSRYAPLKPDTPVTDVFTLPSPWPGDETWLGFPRGVRTLEKAKEYEHGGVSLQECVLPHLVSRRSVGVATLGLVLRVSSPTLTGGTIPVSIVPVVPEGQSSLLGFPPLVVRLWVETAGDGPLREVAAAQEVEVRAEVEELKLAVFLREGEGLGVGQRLTLRATDAATGRELGAVPLELVVEWE